jgi:hypothetical protein
VSYRLELFRCGFTGKAEPHPLRKIQALICHRGSEAEAAERRLILSDIRAMLADDAIDLDIIGPM